MKPEYHPVTDCQIGKGAPSPGARPCILVDTREQRPLAFSDAVDVQRATLPTGDYSIAGCTDLIVIERKSLADLVQCVGRERERFEDELRRLEAFPIRCLIIESTTLDVEAKLYRGLVRPQSVLGSCAAWQVDHGIPVLWAGNARLAARFVERMLVRVHRAHVHASELVPLRTLALEGHDAA